MANRTFTLNEALDLLPVLETLLRRAATNKQRVAEIDAQFQQVNQRIMMHGGLSVDIVPLAHLRAERDKLSQSITDALSEITAMGVQVKDLDIGLLDFMTRYRDRDVCLCWKLGEDRIGFWHGEDEGFRGRKPIDQEFLQHHRGEPPH